MPDDATAKNLIDKIKALPPERIVEVEEFVDALQAQDGDAALARAAAACEPSFAAVWENPEDAVYDEL
jgi:hypothetical protein